MDFENALQNVLQNIGLYHWLYFLMAVSIQIFWNPHVTILAFIGDPPGFSCLDNKGAKVETCDKQCKKYIYGEEFTSIATEWDLVCDEKYKVNFAQEVLMFGFLVGVVVLGNGSDKLGRLRTTLMCLYVLIATQLFMLICKNFFQFALSRFVLGFCIGGGSLTTYVIISENILPHQRALAGTFSNITFALGNVALATMAYFIRDWRMLSLAIAITNIPYILMACIMPESPRWLSSKGRISEAEDVLYHFGKLSNPNFSRKSVSLTTGQEKKSAGGGIFDAFKTPELRRRTLSLMLAWFTCSFVYYGLTMNSSSQGSNRYVSFALSGLVEIPAHLLCTVTLNRVGRKRTLFFALLTGGLCCLFVDFTSPDATGIFSPLALSLAGKMGISMAFNAIYLFSLELLPTVIRNGAMGMCSMAARIGGIAAPMLSTFGDTVTFMGFGVTGIISGLLMLSLPETLGKPLPETIEDVENSRGNKKGMESSLPLATF